MCPVSLSLLAAADFYFVQRHYEDTNAYEVV